MAGFMVNSGADLGLLVWAAFVGCLDGLLLWVLYMPQLA